MWITYNHSINFLDCLFSGKFFEFYEYTLEHRFLGLPADYFIMIYILFGIWNFPTWLISKCVMPLPEVVLLIWCKGIVILFTVLSLRMIRKLLEYLECKDVTLTLFQICTSLCFAIPIFAIGQYDIITVFFVLFGVWQFIKEDKISWRVMLIFAIAMPIKMFSFFSYVFLVLLKEKRILYIVRDLAISMIGCLVCALPYINQNSFYEAMSYNNEGIMSILQSVVVGGIMEIPLLVVCFALLCVFAWLKIVSDKKEMLQYIIWLNAAFYVSFFIFVNANPYWSVWLSVFLVMCMQINPKRMYSCTILEIVASVCLIIVQANSFYWVYFSSDNIKWLLLKDIPIKYDYFNISSLADFIAKLKLEAFVPALYAVFAVMSISIITINCPWNRKKYGEENKIISELKNNQNVIYMVRLASIGVYCLITLVITYII